MPTPEVNPDGSITQASVLLVTGDSFAEQKLNEAYALGLTHALNIMNDHPDFAKQLIELLIKKNTPC